MHQETCTKPCEEGWLSTLGHVLGATALLSAPMDALTGNARQPDLHGRQVPLSSPRFAEAFVGTLPADHCSDLNGQLRSLIHCQVFQKESCWPQTDNTKTSEPPGRERHEG